MQGQENELEKIEKIRRPELSLLMLILKYAWFWSGRRWLRQSQATGDNMGYSNYCCSSCFCVHFDNSLIHRSSCYHFEEKCVEFNQDFTKKKLADVTIFLPTEGFTWFNHEKLTKTMIFNELNMFWHVPCNPLVRPDSHKTSQQHDILITRGSIKTLAIRSDFDFKLSCFRVSI